MIITGGVALGLGVGASIALVLLGRRAARMEARWETLTQEDLERMNQGQPPQNIAARDEAAIAGARSNAGVIASSVAIAAFGVTGIVLLTTGLVQRKRTLRGTPVLGRGYAGLQLALSF